MIAKRKRKQKEVDVKSKGLSLSDKTKQNLEKMVGMSINDLNKLDDKEKDVFVEKKIGKKLTHSSKYVDGYPIKTMEQVNKKLSKIK